MWLSFVFVCLVTSLFCRSASGGFHVAVQVVAVRTWALEEQATACQMILLLAEALQVSTGVICSRSWSMNGWCRGLLVVTWMLLDPCSFSVVFWLSV